MVGQFTRRQWLTLIVISIADFANAICVSLQAPFYPQEVKWYTYKSLVDLKIHCSSSLVFPSFSFFIWRGIDHHDLRSNARIILAWSSDRNFRQQSFFFFFFLCIIIFRENISFSSFFFFFFSFLTLFSLSLLILFIYLFILVWGGIKNPLLLPELGRKNNGFLFPPDPNIWVITLNKTIYFVFSLQFFLRLSS